MKHDLVRNRVRLMFIFSFFILNFFTETIKSFLIEKRKSWNLPENTLQLGLLSELTSATKNFQLGSLVNILRSAANESLKQKLKNLKKPFALEDFLPKIQSYHCNKKL